MLNMNDIVASSYTGQISDLGPVTGSVAVAGQSMGASASLTVGIALTLPKAEALTTLEVNYAGVTYSNFQNFWIYSPNITLLNPPNSANYSVTSNRTAGTLNVVLNYKAGSGGHTLQAHTVTAVAHCYLLPF